MHCVWEIIDNAVDEALAGHGSQIDVELHTDGSVEIIDFGRGVPVDIEPKTGLTGVEVVFTKLHAGGKFGGGSYGSSGGLHGVGASVVNALSARLDVEVDRGGKTYAMSFKKGEPGVFDGTGPDAKFKPFVKKSELKVIGKTAKKVSGTRVRFWPDRQIFDASAKLSLPDLEARQRQTAFLVPGLTLSAKDGKGKKIEFSFEGGLAEFVNFIAKDAELIPVKRIST
jgi:DNA gyrase subunit B